MNRSHNDLRFHGDTLAGPGQLDFAVNVAPGSPPDWLLEALQDGLSQAAAYPNEGPATIALAARHGRPADEVVLLNGSSCVAWPRPAVRAVTSSWGGALPAMGSRGP